LRCRTKWGIPYRGSTSERQLIGEWQLVRGHSSLGHELREGHGHLVRETTEVLVLQLLLELVCSSEKVLHDAGSEGSSVYPHVRIGRWRKPTRPNHIWLLWHELLCWIDEATTHLVCNVNW
jgi:hypothetical protein